jgi:hypothetical protein
VKEIHTHHPDGVIHIETTEPKNFTLRDFFQFLYQDDWGGRTPVQLNNITINSKPADIDTILRNRDLVVVH